MERSQGSFVIFRFGEDNSENVILNLPSVLIANNNQNSASETSQSNEQSLNNSTQLQTQPQASNEDGQNRNDTDLGNIGNQERALNASTEEEHIQRNMLVSVSYVYSGDGNTRTAPAGNNNQDPSRNSDRTGSILLNVPNIPTNRSESQLNALIEFAASIALSALAANIRRHRGVKKESFEKFPVKSKCEVADKTCPICFDEYIEEENKSKGKEDVNDKKETDDYDIINTQGKRKRRPSDDGSENGGLSPRKIRRTESVDHPNNNNGSASSSVNENTAQQSAETEEEFTHIPVVLPCNHTFGRNCLYEWLKSNSTCPLCRQQVAEESGTANAPPERINIPNISSLLNPTSRDNPMVIVLDRSTNTLTTRNNPIGARDGINNNTPEANLATSIVSALTEPQGIPVSGTSTSRDPLSASVLRGLDQPSGFPGLFTSGVASRRTRMGVETVNLDNNNRDDFDNSFYDESRRLIEERLRTRDQPAEDSTNNEADQSPQEESNPDTQQDSNTTV